jgi:hypothetical protein
MRDEVMAIMKRNDGKGTYSQHISTKQRQERELLAEFEAGGFEIKERLPIAL